MSDLAATLLLALLGGMLIWRAFGNRYWPAAYYADETGTLRFHHFGEGRYEEQDALVAKLLAERDARDGARGGRR